jgi:hypothetical protein
MPVAPKPQARGRVGEARVEVARGVEALIHPREPDSDRAVGEAAVHVLRERRLSVAGFAGPGRRRGSARSPTPRPVARSRAGSRPARRPHRRRSAWSRRRSAPGPSGERRAPEDGRPPIVSASVRTQSAGSAYSCVATTERGSSPRAAATRRRRSSRARGRAATRAPELIDVDLSADLGDQIGPGHAVTVAFSPGRRSETPARCRTARQVSRMTIRFGPASSSVRISRTRSTSASRHLGQQLRDLRDVGGVQLPHPRGVVGVRAGAHEVDRLLPLDTQRCSVKRW